MLDVRSWQSQLELNRKFKIIHDYPYQKLWFNIKRKLNRIRVQRPITLQGMLASEQASQFNRLELEIKSAYGEKVTENKEHALNSETGKNAWSI